MIKQETCKANKKKIAADYDKLKENFETKERKAFLFKTLLKQNEAIENEAFDQKEVDSETKQKYIQRVWYMLDVKMRIEYMQTNL